MNANSPALSNWSSQTIVGHELAEAIVEKSTVARDPLIVHVALRKIVNGIDVHGVEVGFIHRLAEKLMGVQHEPRKKLKPAEQLFINEVLQAVEMGRDRDLKGLPPASAVLQQIHHGRDQERAAKLQATAAVSKPAPTVPAVSNEVRMVRMKDIVARIGVSKSTVYKLVKSGDFPEPIRQGYCCTWPASDIEDYLTKLANGRG